jgi:hypothetical protein
VGQQRQHLGHAPVAGPQVQLQPQLPHPAPRGAASATLRRRRVPGAGFGRRVPMGPPPAPCVRLRSVSRLPERPPPGRGGRPLRGGHGGSRTASRGARRRGPLGRTARTVHATRGRCATTRGHKAAPGSRPGRQPVRSEASSGPTSPAPSRRSARSPHLVKSLSDTTQGPSDTMFRLKDRTRHRTRRVSGTLRASRVSSASAV